MNATTGGKYYAHKGKKIKGRQTRKWKEMIKLDRKKGIASNEEENEIKSKRKKE